MNPGILEGLQVHGASGDTKSMERVPGNDNELLLIYFALTPHHFWYPVFILTYLLLSVSSLSVLNFLPPRGSFFKPLAAGALLSLARNLLTPEPSTEAKRVTLSRQARAMHNRPFSWSVLTH